MKPHLGNSWNGECSGFTSPNLEGAWRRGRVTPDVSYICIYIGIRPFNSQFLTDSKLNLLLGQTKTSTMGTYHNYYDKLQVLVNIA